MESAARSARTSFSSENCGTCNGQGVNSDHTSCQPCKGKGSILVMQPSILCPRCNGSGHREQFGFWSGAEHCVVCLGTGWSRTEIIFTPAELIPASPLTEALRVPLRLSSLCRLNRKSGRSITTANYTSQLAGETIVLFAIIGIEQY